MRLLETVRPEFAAIGRYRQVIARCLSAPSSKEEGR